MGWIWLSSNVKNFIKKHIDTQIKKVYKTLLKRMEARLQWAIKDVVENKLRDEIRMEVKRQVKETSLRMVTRVDTLNTLDKSDLSVLSERVESNERVLIDTLVSLETRLLSIDEVEAIRYAMSEDIVAISPDMVETTGTVLVDEHKPESPLEIYRSLMKTKRDGGL